MIQFKVADSTIVCLVLFNLSRWWNFQNRQGEESSSLGGRGGGLLKCMTAIMTNLLSCHILVHRDFLMLICPTELAVDQPLPGWWYNLYVSRFPFLNLIYRGICNRQQHFPKEGILKLKVLYNFYYHVTFIVVLCRVIHVLTHQSECDLDLLFIIKTTSSTV